MNPRQHIFKYEKVSVAARKNASSDESTHRRVPAHLVDLWDESETEPTPPAGHVLRRSEADVLARVFELPILETAPSFPLAKSLGTSLGEEGPDRLPDEVRALKAKWDAEWQKRLDKAVDAARQEGHDAGYADAESKLLENLTEAKEAFVEDATKLKGVWEAFIRKTEPMLAHLAFTMARTILDAPLSPDIQKVVARTLSDAVDQLAGDPPIRISLHPVDLLRLRESGLVDELEATHKGLQWDPVDAMDEGEWVAHSPVAMIRHVKDELLHMLRLRLGLPPLDSA